MISDQLYAVCLREDEPKEEKIDRARRVQEEKWAERGKVGGKRKSGLCKANQ